jgi:hypothetical protein
MDLERLVAVNSSKGQTWTLRDWLQPTVARVKGSKDKGPP